MIFVIFIMSCITGILAILAFVPDLPQAPEFLLSFSDLLTNILRDFSSIYRYIMSPMLALFSLTLIVALLTFEPIYHMIIWILKKLPVVGIK